MKLLSKPLVVTFILLSCSRVCLAEWVIEDVSPARAKELGATVRAQPNGNAGIKVTLEFKPAGELKDFSHVELRVESEEKSVISAPLQVSRPAADRATAHFSADASHVANSSLTIFVPGRLGGEAYRFKMKDFILEKVR